MEFRDVILRRRTTNGPFEPTEVSLEHQHRLMEAASRAPSHFNSQPWRFILVTDDGIRGQIAAIAGKTMGELMGGGRFFSRYKKYFRFSETEMKEKRDGIFIDQLPAAVRPFVKQVFSPLGAKLMSKLGVAKTLGEDNTKLVGGSPLLLAALLTKEEYRKGELSGFYSLLGLGMAIENIWLTTVDLGMGIQFVSTPMEFPDAWAQIGEILHVPEDLELIAVYRLGYVPKDAKRPRIDWTSRHRKRLGQYVFRDTCETPEPDVSQPSALEEL